MKFTHVLVVAIILALFGIVDGKLKAPMIFSILLLLMVGTVAPFIALPLGLVAILWLSYNDSTIRGFITKFAPPAPGTNPGTTGAGPREGLTLG